MWINNIIEQFKSNIINKKINYSYKEIIKNEYINKMGKKIKVLQREEFEDIVFKDNDNDKNILYLKKHNTSIGGNNDEVENLQEDEEVDDLQIYENEDLDYENNIVSDIENISELYDDIDLDKDIKKTDKMISKILNNNQDINKKETLVKQL